MIKKTVEGKLYIQTKRIEVLEDENGLSYFVPLLPLEEMVKNMPSPLLEDIFHVVNWELQGRDHEWVSENL